MSLFDDLIGFGATFDYFTPLITILQDFASGPGHTLLVPEGCGWSGRDVAGLLHRHGVKTWGHMVVNGSLMLRVRKKQARYAQWLLERAGIPLEGGIVGQGKGPDPAPEKASMFDSFWPRLE